METPPNTFDKRITQELAIFMRALIQRYPEVRGIMVGVGYHKEVNRGDLDRQVLCVGDGMQLTTQDASAAVDIANSLVNTACTLYQGKVREMVEESQLVIKQLQRDVTEANRARAQREAETGTTHEDQEGSQANSLQPSRTQGEVEGPDKAAQHQSEGM